MTTLLWLLLIWLGTSFGLAWGASIWWRYLRAKQEAESDPDAAR